MIVCLGRFTYPNNVVSYDSSIPTYRVYPLYDYHYALFIHCTNTNNSIPLAPLTLPGN